LEKATMIPEISYNILWTSEFNNSSCLTNFRLDWGYLQKNPKSKASGNLLGSRAFRFDSVGYGIFIGRYIIPVWGYPLPDLNSSCYIFYLFLSFSFLILTPAIL